MTKQEFVEQTQHCRDAYMDAHDKNRTLIDLIQSANINMQDKPIEDSDETIEDILDGFLLWGYGTPEELWDGMFADTLGDM